jgi:hypothetical protein
MKLLVLFFLVALISSCEGKIVKAIKKAGIEDKQVRFIISGITDFDWDTFRIIYGYSERFNVAQKLNIQYTRDIPEDTMRLFFLKKGSVVYEEDYQLGNENSIYFDRDKSGLVYTKENARFLLSKRKVKSVVYPTAFIYDLKSR